MQDLREVSGRSEGCVCSYMAHHPWVSPHKPPTLIRLTTLT